MQAEKKKQGKFQPFRKLFGKKRKVPSTFAAEVNLKSSHSSGDVRNGIVSANEESEDELRAASISTGTRALSHDSIFIPGGSASNRTTEQVTSPENIPGKIRTLQNHLERNIKFGRPPQTLTVQKMESTRSNSEVDGFSRSPLEECTQEEIQLPASRLTSHDLPNKQSSSLGEAGGEAEEQIPQARLSRPTSSLPSSSSGGTIESINLDAVPQSMNRLDNTAARHKLSVKPRNQRVSKKHGKLALDLHKVTIHEFKYEQEEVQIHVENGQNRYKPVEGNKREEKRHHKDEQQIYREEAEKHKWQENDQTQYELAEHEGREDGQNEEAQRTQEQGQRSHELEEQNSQEEEHRQREIEEQKVREEKQRQRELDEQKVREEEMRQRELKEQQLREEEQRQRELEEQKVREEEERQRELEKQKVREEEQRQRELEEQKVREEEERQRELEEQQIQEEEQRQRELKEQQVREEEEERQRELEEQIIQEERQRREVEEQKDREEEQRLCNEEKQNRIVDLKMDKEERCLETKEMNQRQEKAFFHFSADENKQSDEVTQRKDLEMQRQQKLKKLTDLENPQREDEERKKDDKVLNEEDQQFLEAQAEEQRREELRWKELDQRQTTSQPFSFQVASGDKQIIFPKVNLAPVTHPRETVTSLDTHVLQSSPKSHRGLSSSSYVPHTAILVTGAQLCGTAVDLKQIKDSACKSLLGFSDKKKSADFPFVERTGKSSPDMRSRIGKSKFNPGQSLDQSRALIEWAAIRAKILKSSNERLQEKERRVHSRFSDDWTTFKVSSMHGNLRKTLSANAKFSITPAWQKWADGSKANDSDKGNISHEKVKQNVPDEDVSVANSMMDFSESSKSLTSGDIVQDVTKDIKDDLHSEAHMRKADAAEGCKFAKDLPSFLVPGLPATPRKEHMLPQAQAPLDNRAVSNMIPQTEGMMDTSPFGIKLRRTHYSLRFHYEQQGEQKRKKRYSAGDGMEGIPAFLAAKTKEGESCTVSGKQSSCTKNNKNSNILKNRLSSMSDISHSGITYLSSVDVAKHIQSKLAALSNEKHSSRSQTSQRPALAPKPTLFTAPPSLPIILNKTDFIDIADHKNTKTSLDSDVTKEDVKNGTSMQTCRLKNEDKTKDQNSLFPSINLPWRERADKKTVSITKEKPILQSRHSLDGSRLVDKVETAQPLWITLAMQKQQGFYEQQETREERRQAREAKTAEKRTKENIIVSSCAGSHYVSGLKKSPHVDEKKIGTNVVSRVERREHLKKSATLPNSVTVEICDPVTSIPPVKELPKRFSTPDAAPVSVEPAWLALAKRKAKAWSDCPQIIK
ncbi:capping protein inhibiting regulator of actin dynamics isoform X1 [Amblyraja radiata]|uniref:capping protein inhibiting regulator of actin dynamics isoform X1 n=1 Tax=Amblyraja radiata TaxID=386614 RepID=UPI001403E59D|nr:capping protein inhibiting regulator of actin dynamics isoform X1 [Amblyraja radiata]